MGMPEFAHAHLLLQRRGSQCRVRHCPGMDTCRRPLRHVLPGQRQSCQCHFRQDRHPLHRSPQGRHHRPCPPLCHYSRSRHDSSQRQRPRFLPGPCHLSRHLRGWRLAPRLRRVCHSRHPDRERRVQLRLRALPSQQQEQVLCMERRRAWRDDRHLGYRQWRLQHLQLQRRAPRISHHTSR